MKRPHVDTAANELPMLFVLMSLSSSPFRSHTLMVVSGYDVITKPLMDIPMFMISLSVFCKTDDNIEIEYTLIHERIHQLTQVDGKSNAA